MTRRRWFGSMLGGLAALRRARAARLTWGSREAAETFIERQYRADAQVLLLGIPILHRQGVGGGHASWREWRGGIRQLEFAGYSLPEHAAGLNRLGFIREMSRWSESGMAESIYFGLMTASPEESADEARKALHSNAKDALYTAIDGRVSPGEVETSIAHFIGPVHVAALSELEDKARQALSSAAKLPVGFDASLISPPPFLHAIAAALQQARPAESRYTYRGRLYKMWLRPAADPKATEEFRKRGLLAEGRKVARVTGGVQRLTDGQAINFRLWVEEGAPRPVPLRIDYQAKAYLRLIFEAV